MAPDSFLWKNRITIPTKRWLAGTTLITTSWKSCWPWVLKQRLNKRILHTYVFHCLFHCQVSELMQKRNYQGNTHPSHVGLVIKTTRVLGLPNPEDLSSCHHTTWACNAQEKECRTLNQLFWSSKTLKINTKDIIILKCQTGLSITENLQQTHGHFQLEAILPVTELTRAAKCHFKYTFRKLSLRAAKCSALTPGAPGAPLQVQTVPVFFSMKLLSVCHLMKTFISSFQSNLVFFPLSSYYCYYYWKAVLGLPHPKKQLFTSTLQLNFIQGLFRFLCINTNL